MPNRDLKECNRRSASLQLMSDAAERLWYRLITSVDDFGRLEADPEVVFTNCFQRVPKGWTVKKVESCLRELATCCPDGEAPMIQLYTVGAKRYLQITSASSHIYRRAKESKFPAPPVTPQEISLADECAQVPADSLGTPNSELRISESRSSNPESRTLTNSPDGERVAFDEFWNIYPRKDGKQAAERAWKKLDMTRRMFLLLQTALARQRDSPQWTKDSGAFIPHASTWLNGRRWEDAGVSGGESFAERMQRWAEEGDAQDRMAQEGTA